MKSKLIAPCGMNCALCIAYLREKKPCPGCKFMKEPTKKCKIKHCIFIKNNKLKFCSDECPKFPCIRLKTIDERYRLKYEMSMIENLKVIKYTWIRKFLKQQKAKYISNNKWRFG